MLTRFIKIQLVLFTILTIIALVALGWYYLRVPSLVGIGQYTLHAALVNVPRDAHFLFSFDEKFRQETVLHDGDSALLGRRIDEDFLFHTNLRRKAGGDSARAGHLASAVNPQRPSMKTAVFIV